MGAQFVTVYTVDGRKFTRKGDDIFLTSDRNIPFYPAGRQVVVWVENICSMREATREEAASEQIEIEAAKKVRT